MVFSGARRPTSQRSACPMPARRPARARSRTLLTIAGRCRTFIEANFQSHGFLRGADGTLTAFDPPGSASTGVSGINLSGEIVGDYDDSSFKTLGFLRSAIGALKDRSQPSLYPARGPARRYLASITWERLVALRTKAICGIPPESTWLSRCPAPRHPTEPFPSPSTLAVTGYSSAAPANTIVGFIRSADGTFTTFGVDGSFASKRSYPSVLEMEMRAPAARPPALPGMRIVITLP